MEIVPGVHAIGDERTHVAYPDRPQAHAVEPGLIADRCAIGSLQRNRLPGNIDGKSIQLAA